METPRTPGSAGFEASLPSCFSDSESDFYNHYSWCLNPFPKVNQTIGFLRNEIDRLEKTREKWQIDEVMTNIFLLSCSISDSSDDYLCGKEFDFSRIARILPFTQGLFKIPETFFLAGLKIWKHRRKKMRLWRAQWEKTLDLLLRLQIQNNSIDENLYKKTAQSLSKLLDFKFPDDFNHQRIRNPAAFRSQDLTFHDILKLSEKFYSANNDYDRPILVVGLRTAGSYFGPVFRSYLINRGYKDVGLLTLRPKRGASGDIKAKLRGFSRRNGLVAIIDEPVYKGSTLIKCVEILRGNGFLPNATIALFPLHPTVRQWRDTDASIALNGCQVVTLTPEESFKHELFGVKNVEARMQGYFAQRGWQDARVAEDPKTVEFNEKLQRTSEEKFHTRLKQVYGVIVKNGLGKEETRYVVAKSVGWGWFGYQAFFAANKLSAFIPPVLGLRDGILFSEWVEGDNPELEKDDRNQLTRSIAEYVAARVNGLRLPEDPSSDFCRKGVDSGMNFLAKQLSDSAGSKAISNLKQYDILHKLSRLSCPFASLIDGKMRRLEWLRSGKRILKTDFEQHGFGKIEINVADPAYDIADSVFSFGFSKAEENDLTAHYAKLSGDTQINERLPLHKILTGVWTMDSSMACIENGNLAFRHREFNRIYIDAWTFLMVQMARYCASFLQKPALEQSTRSLVVSDVDGIIDRDIFGIPMNTISGIRAVSLLNSHGFPIVLNTARSAYEVREYCSAYGFIGGVAESGSYVWDAATGKDRILVSEEALDEIKRVRGVLEKLSGIYTNHFYRYSIKAFTYEDGRTVQLPQILIQDVLKDAGVKNLTLRQSSIDSTIVSKDIDKGKGMIALLNLIGRADAETIAIGDSAPDLAMFRLANRSYAPSHIYARELALLLGCRIARKPYQMGFLEIVRDIIHSDKDRCPNCREPQFCDNGHDRILLDILGEVEKSKLKRLRDVVFNAHSMDAFIK